MQKRTKLTESQLKVKKLIAPLVKNLVKEATAYERGSHSDLIRRFDIMADYLQGWSRQLSKENVNVRELDGILYTIDKFAKDIKLHRDNWDN